MSNLVQFLFFLLNNGDKIADQTKQLMEFVDWIIDNYGSKGGETSASSDLGSVQLDELSEKFPMVATMCDSAIGNRTGASAFVGRRGVFGDLVKWIIENPDKAIELFLKFKDLFGLQAPAVATGDAAE